MSALLHDSEKVSESRESDARLRVLLVPDSTHWILGTIAKSIATANPMDGTIVSGPVLGEMFADGDAIAERFDLVHFLCPYASREWLPRLADKMPVVTSHHHVTSWDLIRHNIDGDAIIAGSQEWVRDLETRGADMSRVFRVPYGVDVDLFAPSSEDDKERSREALGLTGAGPVVGFFAKRASNDDDRKGTDVFVDAMLRLNERDKGAAALIVGPGWKDLVRRFHARGIRTAWIPFAADTSRLPPLYRALDFYWVTSRVEGGPVPLLEAMSTGMCCLSTPVGLALEVIDDGENAVLLPMNDAAAFVDATMTLWSDRERMRMMGNAARKKMVSTMRAQDVATLVQPVYDRAMQVFSSRIEGRSRSIPTSARRGLDASERRKVAMLEDLAWAENLVLYQSEHGAALKLILKAWADNPLSPMPVRVFLRRFLPERITRGVVATKRKLLGGAG